MEVRELRYFLAVAREENITRAAESLHIAQPSLSKQLMELEKKLGKKGTDEWTGSFYALRFGRTAECISR